MSDESCTKCHGPIWTAGETICWSCQNKGARPKCLACGCVIYPDQATYPREKDLMHIQCGHDADRAWPNLPQGEEFNCDRFLLHWPASLLSDEWKDFWMASKKRDRIAIGTQRAATTKNDIPEKQEDDR